MICAHQGGVGGDEFRFLAVAKWEHRKGFDVLLRAYWAEFASDVQAVVLRLRTCAVPLSHMYCSVSLREWVSA